MSKQDFTPWGEIRGGGSGIQETTLNFTGQRRDSTGLLYYHARYYDPNLGRFLSADSVVPGTPDGGMDGVALKALTVDFHEGGFVTSIAKENTQTFWFQMSSQERQQANVPWGPINAQALNRYSYVQNNPLKYTDPTGHHEIGDPGGGNAKYGSPGSNGGRFGGGYSRPAATSGTQSTAQPSANSPANGARPSEYQKPPTGKRPTGYRKGVTDDVRKKNDGKCVYCSDEADTNDHVKPWKEIKKGTKSRGDELDRFNDTDNLIPACRSCNSSKGARPAPNPTRARPHKPQ